MTLFHGRAFHSLLLMRSSLLGHLRMVGHSLFPSLLALQHRPTLPLPILTMDAIDLQNARPSISKPLLKPSDSVTSQHMTQSTRWVPREDVYHRLTTIAASSQQQAPGFSALADAAVYGNPSLESVVCTNISATARTSHCHGYKLKVRVEAMAPVPAV